MSAKVTPWFKSSIQPVRKGLYEVRCKKFMARFNSDSNGESGMRYFDGVEWWQAPNGRLSNFGRLPEFKDEWRGLAEKP